MISEIQIENFKSIASLTLEPGDVTVLIGENGSGKSNILEAIAFASAASVDKLDDEFLFSRGVRVTDKSMMLGASPARQKSAFHVFSELPKQKLWIEVLKVLHDWEIDFLPDPSLVDDGLTRSERESALSRLMEKLKMEQADIERNPEIQRPLENLAVLFSIKKDAPLVSAEIGFSDFLIYAPENTALRNFETEGAIKPLGTKGEGLLRLLTRMAESGNGKFSKELNSNLQLLGWFGELHLPTENDELRGRVRIRDRYLGDKGPVFDQRSANEGFLYLLFYFTLMLSKQTPAFFAIDNIDNALNPKLCSELIRHLAKLAKKMGKQMICTTHNPAILDGLNLKDDRQRLYVVRRDSQGHTVADRVKPPRPRPDGPPVKLSEAFMSGLLGGLPEHF